MRPSRAVAILLALLVGGAGMGIAEAQTPPPVLPTTTTSTTSSTTTTSTTAPPPATTSTLPGGGTTPPDNSGEVGSQEPPPDNVTVPPPAQPEPPPPNAPVFNAELQRQLKLAQRQSRAADSIVADLGGQATALQSQIATWTDMLLHMEAEHGRVIRRLEAARARLRHRALGVYTGNSLGTLNALLNAGDINELVRRSGMVEGVLHESQLAVKEYAAAKKAAGDTIARLVDQIADAQSQLALTQVQLQGAYTGAVDAHLQVDALAAGSAIAIKGFVFPVAAPHHFSNDFGAPRMTGTPYQHTHQGNDIFATYGAPLVACERGVVARVGQDLLGGNNLWLVGQSGTRYYYAHISGYPPGIHAGMVVEAGTLVAFVGDTGNAKGGSPHLHFEVHPQGGAAVNPYFLLSAAEKAGAVVAPPPTSTPPPTQAA